MSDHFLRVGQSRKPQFETWGGNIMASSILQQIEEAIQSCETAVEPFRAERSETILQNLLNEVAEVHRASSQSWIGYHSRLYVKDLTPPTSGEEFDIMWGLMPAMSSHTHGDWYEYDYQTVMNTIMERAGVAAEERDALDAAARAAMRATEGAKAKILPSLDAFLAKHKDARLEAKREEIAGLKVRLPESKFVEADRPSQVITRDETALAQGLQVPHHMGFRAKLYAQWSAMTQSQKLTEMARYVHSYIRATYPEGDSIVRNGKSTIFIGHGKSKEWRELKDFLADRLSLDWEEFNRQSTAGISVTARLNDMTALADFAFIVMTAEDEHADGTQHPRENAIHEAGLFQGKLGFAKAIIMLEQGCTEFSNIAGLQQIRFPAGQIASKFEEVRLVLEREGII